MTSAPLPESLQEACREIPRTLRAGIEIKLQPGWKTYWRYPGDSGVPPQFDFAGSENLASAEVLYPAPHSFKDEAGTSIGYKETVVFPVASRPAIRPSR